MYKYQPIDFLNKFKSIQDKLYTEELRRDPILKEEAVKLVEVISKYQEEPDHLIAERMGAMENSVMDELTKFEGFVDAAIKRVEAQYDEFDLALRAVIKVKMKSDITPEEKGDWVSSIVRDSYPMKELKKAMGILAWAAKQAVDHEIFMREALAKLKPEDSK